MRAAEERIKQLKGTEDYQRPVTRYRYDRGGRGYVPIEEPPSERERLQLRIQNNKKRLPLLKISDLKSLEVFKDSGFGIIKGIK